MKSTLEEQVEKYLRSDTGLLSGVRFPAELDARFEVERLEQRSRQVMFTATLALVFFNLFLFADYAKHPSVIWRCVLLRLGVASPIILISIWAMKRRARAAIRETLVLASICVAGAVVLATSYNLNRIDSMFSQTGFMLIVFFGTLILRQQFFYAVATLATMLFEDLLFLGTDRWMTGDDKIMFLFVVVTSISLALVANYGMERQERTSFAHFMKEGFHSKALGVVNQKLTALSQVDGLTGLSNRRHFDDRFQALWEEAAARESAVSLVMVDIDHFKRLNDTFGHIAGDRVLVRMGQILAACVRTGEDVVARFGGEEFILLLAGATHEDAHGVADALQRLLSARALLPAETDGTVRPVTVSCGVATTVPVRDGDRLQLIVEADLALYAAKRGGRNRVACRMCEAVAPERRRQTEVGDRPATDLQVQ